MAYKIYTNSNSMDELNDNLPLFKEKYRIKVDKTLTREGDAAESRTTGVAIKEAAGVIADKASLNKNSHDDFEINGFENAAVGTVPVKKSTGVIGWDTTYTEEEIDAKFAQEKLERQTADQEITTNLNAEISRSTLKDTQLTNDLAAEVQNRTNADIDITAALSAEILRSTTREDEIETNLNAEISRSTQKDTSLETAITNEVSARTTADLELTAAINQEITDRTSAINNEKTERQNADTALQTNIDTEKALRESADTTLQTNINTEKSARENADTTLQTNIDNEKSARETADSNLTTAINTETTNRTTADDTLLENINAEATTRASADSALSERITNLEARGRFLSSWDATTGLPETNPTELPYLLKAGDYFIVSKVASTGETNKKPEAKSVEGKEGLYYTGDASVTVETRELGVGDFYTFDKNKWVLIENTQKSVTFGMIGGEPSDNEKLNVELTTLHNHVANTSNPHNVKAEQAKIDSDLYSYYNIGKIVIPEGQLKVKVASKGDSIRDVLNNILVPNRVNPNITQPTVNMTLTAPTTDDEIGTTFNTLNYNVSTTNGNYEFGPATNVSWTKFVLSENDKSTDVGTSTSGSITLKNAYTLGDNLSVKCVGTHNEGVKAYDSLGDETTLKIEAGNKEITKTFSKSPVTYAYTKVTSASVGPLDNLTKQSNYNTFAVNGALISYNAGEYIYFYTQGSGKTVQTYVLGQWANVDTQSYGEITITQANGKTRQANCYRIGPFGASGSDKYRV